MRACVEFRSDWPIFQMGALRLMGRTPFVPLAHARVQEGEEGNVVKCEKPVNLKKNFSVFVIFATCLEI